MSLFEYIAILVSLGLGLAISNTLIKISFLLQFSRHLSQSWHVLMWSLLVLFSSVAFFFTFWTMYSSTTDISIAEFTLAPFFTVILFFLLSRFLPINDSGDSEILLEDYFLKYKNAFFLCFSLLWLQMFAVGHLIILPRLGLEFSLLQKSQYLLPLILAAGIKINNTEQHKKLVGLYAIIYVFQEFIATSIE